VKFNDVTWPGMLRHGLIHDYDQGCIGAVIQGEVPAIEQRIYFPRLRRTPL
jgi:hypothetical protein